MNPPVLYHSVSARSFRPLWVMEELGLDYDLRMVPFPPRVEQRDYLQVNPLGTVPALVCEQGLMTESVAICQYLAARYGPTGLALEPHEPDFASYLNFLHFGEATLTFPQTLVLRYRHFEPAERQLPQVAEDYARWFLSRLKALDARLRQRTTLCAERFTIADVSVGYACLLAQHLGLLTQAPERVQDYWQSLAQRPAFQGALRAQHDAALAQGVSTQPAPAQRPWA